MRGRINKKRFLNAQEVKEIRSKLKDHGIPVDAASREMGFGMRTLSKYLNREIQVKPSRYKVIAEYINQLDEKEVQLSLPLEEHQERKTRRVQLVVTESFYSQIDVEAWEERKSVNSFIQDSLRKYMEIKRITDEREI